MRTTKRTLWLGALLFSVGLGCGSASNASDLMTIPGSDVASEQLALADSDGAGARDKAGRSERSELDRLKKLLDLSADQVTQIQPILDATRAALEEVRAQVKAGTLSESDAHAQVKAQHDAQKQQILALLTAEQQAKFSELRDHHAGPFDLKRLTEALGLDDAQVKQIDDLMVASQTKIHDVHAQVEAGTLTREEARTQIDQIRTDTRAAIEAVLTAEQKAELDKITAKRGDHKGPDGGGCGPGGPKGPGGPGGGGPGKPGDGSGSGGTSSPPGGT